MHPSSSITTMGREDDAVARAAGLRIDRMYRLPLGKRSVQYPLHEYRRFPLGLPGGSHLLQLAGGHALVGRRGNQAAVLALIQWTAAHTLQASESLCSTCHSR
jgi:hypothetical protein